MSGLTPRGYPYPDYSDPADFPFQIADFAVNVDADVDNQVTLQQTALNAPSARVTASANQAITASTDTFLTFAVEAYDNASMVNLGVNNDRITFTQTGIYLIHAECIWAGNGNATLGGRKLVLHTSTDNEVCYDTRRGAQAERQDSSVTYLYKATVINSFVRARVTHTSGAAVNVGLRSFSATRVSS